MSAMDSVDYDLMKYEQKQDRANELLDEFCEKAAQIIANARKDLGALTAEYFNDVNYDALAEGINSLIKDELIF